MLIPSDTLALNTADYVCGYILQKEDLYLPQTDCEQKIIRKWSVLDWCNATNGPQPIDTTIIDFKDTTPPEFEMEATTPLLVDLANFACTFDVQQIALPKAMDNCSTPTVQLNQVRHIQDGQLLLVPTSEWATLKGDSFQLEWIATCLLYTSPSPRDLSTSRMPSSA